MSLAEEFANKQLLPQAFQAAVLMSPESRQQFLSLTHPVALARFVAFVKSRMQAAGTDVFLRGQTADYPGMVPALFRTSSWEERLHRLKAYQQGLDHLQRELGYLRFARENAGAVFQHYGLQTPWLDLVDNLYTALWFATHEHVDCDGQSYYRRSARPYGWIYLVATAAAGVEPLICVDLRKEQSSMNVRLQVQHGVSVASQGDLGEPIRYDYALFVIARVRVPNDRRFSFEGTLAKSQFLFPPPALDESSRILLESRANELLAETEACYGLKHEVLGRVRRVRYRAPNAKIEHINAAS